MMRYWIVLFSSLFLLGACKNNKIERPEKPENLISKDQMVDIIYDMSLISAAKGVNKKIIENRGINPEQYIYEKHEIDSLQFALSNEYYAYDIKTYQELYDRVKQKLEIDKKRFNSMIDSEKTKSDSISRRNRLRRDSIIKARTEEAKYGL